MATVQPNLIETVLELWRRGIRLEALPGRYKIRLYPSGRVDWPLYFALKDLKPVLIRRLRKPPGWPRYVELPDWWSEISPAFEIVKARAFLCGWCRFPVAVEVVGCKHPGWYCPKCGKPADPPHRGRKPKSKDDDRESESSCSGQTDDLQSSWSEAT